MTLILEEILSEAMRAGASDLHITVGASPKMRVNGKLVSLSYPKFMPEDTLEMLISIMTETQREQFEKQGEYDCSITDRELGRFRVSAYRQRGCVALAFRLMGVQIPKAEELGIPDSVMEWYQKETGLIIVTGLSGSGKSATLAVLLDKINSMRESHIITLESPVEYLHEHKQSIVEQREIGADSRSYPAALEAVLREDPDVIFVGEMRDLETIGEVITAAETGHLVLVSMPVQGTVTAIERMIDLFPTYRQQQIRLRLANVLQGVVSQQLLPNERNKNRVSAFEVMQVTSEIRTLIREGKTSHIPAVMERGEVSGMITMDGAVKKLFGEGKIVQETVMWYAQRNHNI
ncbi:MAG: PilT/PilU family type 4a pilus ATPase [Lachnospiraceae bacterium]|nr:PilT/PilU family type 4a pilus ATPase [Lachnospiraceae bacterium]